jgi:hypothetical protein
MATDTPTERPARPRWRIVVGWIAFALTLVAIGAIVMGAANPGSLVAVRVWCGDLMLDSWLTLIFGLVMFWLLVPLRSEASQGGRLAVRALLVVAVLVGALAYGFSRSQGYFDFSPLTIGRSPDGTRTAVLLTNGAHQRVHVFVGHGLTQRDAGDLGEPCGTGVTASFTGNTGVVVQTEYGDFHLPLDPATGRPLETIGHSCSPS